MKLRSRFSSRGITTNNAKIMFSRHSLACLLVTLVIGLSNKVTRTAFSEFPLVMLMVEEEGCKENNWSEEIWKSSLLVFGIKVIGNFCG